MSELLEPYEFATNPRSVAQRNFNAIEARLTGYRHIQSVPASVWTINHGLGRRSIPSCYDSAGDVIWGAIRFLDDNTTTVTYGAQFSGEAFVP